MRDDRISTAQANTRAKPWVWGHPPFPATDTASSACSGL